MHLSAQWKAGKRAEDVITEWEPIMGNMVEVFFPTKRKGSMEEKHFLEEQERNIERGSRYGLRQGQGEARIDLFEEVKEKETLIEDLETKLKLAEERIVELKENEKVERLGFAELNTAEKDKVIEGLKIKYKTLGGEKC